MAPAAAGAKAAVAAPAPAVAAHSGLLGYQMQLSDDGKTALVEMVFSDPVAFQSVMQQEASSRNVTVPATADASPAAVSTSLSTALQT